mgnify:CR=1 FL=1
MTGTEEKRREITKASDIDEWAGGRLSDPMEKNGILGRVMGGGANCRGILGNRRS